MLIQQPCVRGDLRPRASDGRAAFRITAGADKFEQRAPSPQNAIDIFDGRWASDLSDLVPGLVSGSVKHFTADPRPGYAMRALAGDRTGRALGVLELGPLEGGHTHNFDPVLRRG